MQSSFITILSDAPASLPQDGLHVVAERPVAACREEAEILPSRLDQATCKGDDFATQQIRRLVRQLFLEGPTKPPIQIVFTGVDKDTDVAGLCTQIAQALSAQVDSSVVLVEAGLSVRCSVEDLRNDVETATGKVRLGTFRSSSRQISGNLWFVRQDEFWENGQASVLAMQGRLKDLRNTFDYSIISAPAAGSFGEAVILGQLCDGAVLVLEANFTRRLAANRVKEALQQAKVNLMGTILSGRTFPIPEFLYRRL